MTEQQKDSELIVYTAPKLEQFSFGEIVSGESPLCEMLLDFQDTSPRHSAPSPSQL